jgi:hypothetical protein
MVILLLAAVIGMLAGGGRAWWGGHKVILPTLRLTWLVPIAVVPQILMFYLPGLGPHPAGQLVAVGLMTSQLLLLGFAWINRHQPGFWLLGLGLLLNFAAISLNGGLMPLSPEMASRLIPEIPPEAWVSGSRFGNSKDIILPLEATSLWSLSDRFFLSIGNLYRMAFSIGDVLLAGGALWWLWSLGGPKQDNQELNSEHIRIFVQ